MHYKRAIGISVLNYIVSMILGGVACAMMGLKPDITQPIPMEMWIVSAILAVILSVGGAFWYFKGKGLHPSLDQGLRFGGTMILTGFILDLLFFYSLSFQGYDPLAGMAAYYVQPPFWITLILILIGSGLVGQKLGSKK